tara:strand:+ start:116 stop:1060 length:945 start_codon:yes stop_codon:yes gene_type:complete
MKFNLSVGHVAKGKPGGLSTISLPSGQYQIKINPSGSPVADGRKCYILQETTKCVLIDVGFVGYQACGDALITMAELGYDLSSKDDLKRAKTERETISSKYQELVQSKPELFDSKDMEVAVELDESIPFLSNESEVEKFVNENDKKLKAGILFPGFDRDLIISDTKICTQPASGVFGGFQKLMGEEGLTEVFYQDVTNFIFTPASALHRGQFQIVVKGQVRKDTGWLSGNKGKNDPFTVLLKLNSNNEFQSAKKLADYFLGLSKTGGTQQTVVVQSNEAEDIPSQIKKLSDLKDQGILTEEEFSAKKADLLSKM